MAASMCPSTSWVITSQVGSTGGVVQCAGGYRSSIAASLIMRELPEVPVADLVGGLEAWEAAGLPTVKEDS